MKDNENLLKILNQRLNDELAAISQYTGNSEIRNHWTYGILKKTFENQTLGEMHYASWLIQRIIFVEGITAVKKLNTMSKAKTDFELVVNNRDVEIKELIAHNTAFDH